jgi:hypothetical protein
MPRRPIPVEILSADMATHGTLANISELGACVWTSAAVAAGDVLVLGFGFPGEGQPFHAAGCVVWSEPSELGGKLRRCGLRWPHSSGRHHELLKTMIANC